MWILPPRSPHSVPRRRARGPLRCSRALPPFRPAARCRYACRPLSATELLADRAALPAGICVRARIPVEAGRIATPSPAPARSSGAPEPLRGDLLPGFVDLQVNGAGGRSVGEATPAALDAVARAVWSGGAVAFLPTLVTAPWDRLLDQLARVARWTAAWTPADPAAAEPLGLHLEGPFLSVPGAHDASCLVDPTPARVDDLLAAAQGRLRLVTLASDRPGAAEATARLRAAGVAVAIGHVQRTEGLRECVAAGATAATHLFNAMGGVHHRAPGVAATLLDLPAVQCALIVDGAHLHPVTVRNAFRLLGPARTLLVTDAVAAAGMPDGQYELAGRPVRAAGGVVRDAEGRLSGSALTMGRAARNFLATVEGAGAWTLATIGAANPAALIGAGDYGAIAPGRRAAFTLLGDDGSVQALRA